MSSLIEELKRRNVVKVALLYIITGWLILQAADVLFALLGLPDWTLKLVLGILLLGLPVALILSWIYEITPEGIKLEKEVDRNQSITPNTGRKINIAIMGGLAVAIGLMLYQQFGPGRGIETAPTTADPASESLPTIATPAAADGIPSVAVLPFVNMSSDAEQDYFADGLSDTLMHVLAQVRGLKVAARTSSFAFKGKNVNVSEIARELGVGTILEGSVQKSGGKVRVIAQLVDASDGAHLWSANFDRDLEDIFAIQDEIAQEVVSALKVALLDEDETRLAKRYQPSLEAYEQLILGRQEVEKRTAASLAKAEQHFKQAIELDPNYALAYVGLADTHDLQVGYADLGYEASIELRMPLVDKALELEPLSGEAITSWASILSDRGEREQAVEAYQRAIELSPSYARAYQWYGNLLGAMGRYEMRLEMGRRASELDPLSPIIRTNYSGALWNMGRVEEAMLLIREGIEKNPDFPAYYTTMQGYLQALGRLGESRRWHEEGLKRNPEGLTMRSATCFLDLQLANDLAAESCLNALAADYPNNLAVINLKISLNFVRQDHQGNLDILGELDERFASNTLVMQQINVARAIVLAQMGDLPGARRSLEAAYPAFFSEDDPGVDDTNWDTALWAAWILFQTGDDQRPEILLDAVERIIATRHRIRGLGYGVGDVVMLTIRGQTDQALDKLREAIDQGWRANWRFSFFRDVRLSALWEDQRFITMAQEVEDDILAQRAWYEENRDAPLL